MKRQILIACAALAASIQGPAASRAALLVNDTWQDGNRTDPATAVSTGPHSEFGLDADMDGDLESVWYTSPGAAMAVSTGHLTMTQQTGSSSYTSYFAPDATPVTLAQGDTLRVTWRFTPSGVGTNTGRGLRLALVNTAGADRLIGDASPALSTFTGYRISLNVAQSLIANTIELRERTVLTSDNLLVNDDRWNSVLTSVGATGATGMIDGTEYTFVWSIKRTFADELEIAASVSGSNYAGTGSLSLSFVDATPNAGSFDFDTFAIRPSSAASTATTFDTTLFRVEHIPVPEPATAALVSVCGLAVLASRRRG